MSRSQVNQKAYKRLKDEIARTYAHGRFVAIHNGKIAADAASFEELDDTLNAQGIGTRDVLIAQAGISFPDYVSILSQRTSR